MEPDFLSPDAEHVHDQSITSVGISESGDLDMDKMNGWLGTLLREKGVDMCASTSVLAHSPYGFSCLSLHVGWLIGIAML